MIRRSFLCNMASTVDTCKGLNWTDNSSTAKVFRRIQNMSSSIVLDLQRKGGVYTRFWKGEPRLTAAGEKGVVANIIDGRSGRLGSCPP